MTNKQDTRQRILDTASSMFHTQSYNAVGVAAICNKADVSKGSFFHFFKSKQDLALAVMDHFQLFINQQLISKAFSSSIKPLQRFDDFVFALYNFQNTQTEQNGHMPGCPFGNMAMEQATQDEVLRKKAESCLNGLGNQFLQTITEAMECGVLPDIDAKATADAMLSYIEGVQLLAKTRNDPELILKLGPVMKSIKIERTG